MSISLTANNFPKSVAVKDPSGLPWGCVVQPLATWPQSYVPQQQSLPPSDKIARCKQCYGYMNKLATFDRKKWRCPLCGTWCSIPDRYASLATRHQLPELVDQIYEISLPMEDDFEIVNGPAYIGLVDATGGDEFQELVKSALQAAMEGIPGNALFALMTFDGRVGAYDLRAARPHIRHIGVPKDGNPALALQDLYPLQHMLVPVADCRDNIGFAIDTLRSSSNLQFRNEGPRRALGAAVDAVLDLLDSCTPHIPARLIVFLSGIPNFGRGSLHVEDPANLDQIPSATALREKTPFYHNMGEKAAGLGSTVDIFSVTNEYLDLASLRPLTLLTGGELVLYDPSHTSLPQDVYRLVTYPCGWNGELRVRTSPEFRAACVYGPVTPHPKFDYVYRIPTCRPHTAVTLDFEFTTSSAFQKVSDRLPTVQVAYAYTRVRAISENMDPNATPPPSSALERVLRLVTIQCPLAATPHDLLASANPLAIITLLVHKVLAAVVDSGVKEARLLLEDWLVLLLARFNVLINPALKNAGSSIDFRHIDMSFAGFSGLSFIPRLVYLLAVSPLLRLSRQSHDRILFLHNLISSLEPLGVERMIAPEVLGFAGLDNVLCSGIPLSRDAFTASGASIFIIDAYTDLLLYYSASATDLPFPPPHDCGVRRALNEIRGSRPITPRQVMIRAGTSEAQQLEDWLVEDAVPNSRPGLVPFLQYIAEHVCAFITS